MTAPLSAIDIDAEIIRISQRLDKQVSVLAKRARAAAEADVDWKIAHAKAILTAEGPTAVLLAAQEAGRSLRSQIDALRTLAASQRAALTYSEGVGG